MLVNNAAIGTTAPFLELDEALWRRMLEIDLTGAFLASQAAARLMVEAGDGGRIINIASIHGQVPRRGGAAYCSAKGGLEMLSKSMALDLAEHGITVNAVAPGRVESRIDLSERTETSQARMKTIPAGRPGHPLEISAMVRHLASPEAGYTTGQTFIVDGGMLLMAGVLNQDNFTGE